MLKGILAAGAVISGLVSLPAAAQADDTLTPIEFRNSVIETMQALSDEELCFVRLSEESFRSGTSPDNCDFEAHLDAAYRTYVSSPETLDSVIADYAGQYVDLITAGIDYSNFENRLVVQLRSRSYVRNVNLGADSPLVARPFAGDLMAVLMLDSPQTLAAVSEEQLADQDVSADEAFELAVGNTRELMGEVREDEYRRIQFASSSNGLISGQIWLPETCNASSEDAVYFLYDRNGLMSVSMEDALGVSNLLAVANGLVIQGEALTSSVVSCQSGQWTQLWPARTADNSAFNPYLPG
ncbi:hypothetical protein [Ponticaulis sp.]|uniref:hypothetical protein n=1 Tax=Ponticaulis sp. TaxID=2020902 RepID=UPI000B67E8AF|nr:hypothetical protein [Ponticaulis sp.]MAI89188.1 hypothetical protein [Ponticaulis sp.]OUY01182.1 MAG: hypothetical protein CBB65_01725 [Hyphomonadaceae bacterium TMED5]|tara:strand:+ start:78248 stop:79138 length:891 start_codon:yes stop_codon:yes gene_type:complete